MRFKTFLFPLIVLFFTGCASVKTEFIYPEILDISEPPATQDYNLSVIKINNIEYYSLSLRMLRFYQRIGLDLNLGPKQITNY